ncbi:MAG: hypothetical protein H7240_10260 [Glaciimonas sp.]|nr:hypothetical protein [Glaciimonas sp.]
MVLPVLDEIKVDKKYTPGCVLNIFGNALRGSFSEFFKAATRLYDRLMHHETSPETFAKIEMTGDVIDRIANVVPSMPNAFRQLIGSAFLLGADATDGREPSLQDLNNATSGGGY